MALPPSLLCAWLSWNLVEQPILNRKKLIFARVDRVCLALFELARPILPSGESGPRLTD